MFVQLSKQREQFGLQSIHPSIVLSSKKKDSGSGCETMLWFVYVSGGVVLGRSGETAFHLIFFL